MLKDKGVRRAKKKKKALTVCKIIGSVRYFGSVRYSVSV